MAENRSGASLPRRVALRSSLVCAGLLLGALALEGILATLALAIAPSPRPTLAPRSMDPPGGWARRILCIGDSNTFGVHLDETDSYPSRLGALLAAAPDGPWRVQNAGFPGRNSAEARYLLVEQLATHRPDIVVAWVGMNNTWSRWMGHLWELEDHEAPPPSTQFVERLYSIRMARILLQRPMRRPVESVAVLEDVGGAEFDAHSKRADVVLRGAEAHAEFRRRLALDLTRIRALCDAAGARLLVVDYPFDVSHVRDLINPTIRAFVEKTGTAYLSLDEEIGGARIGAFGHGRMLFPDYHFRGDGNGEVARLVANAFVREGWIGAGDWLDVPVLEDLVRHAGISVERRDRTLHVTLRGAPGGAGRAVVHALVRRAADAGEGGAAVPEVAAGARPIAEVAAFPADAAVTRELVLPDPPHDVEAAFGPGARFVGWRIVLRAQLDEDVGTAWVELDPEGEPMRAGPPIRQ